jgi:hypothetical protein
MLRRSADPGVLATVGDGDTSVNPAAFVATQALKDGEQRLDGGPARRVCRGR